MFPDHFSIFMLHKGRNQRIIPIVKHGYGSVMIWACSSALRPQAPDVTVSTMNSPLNQKLCSNMISTPSNLSLGYSSAKSSLDLGPVDDKQSSFPKDLVAVVDSKVGFSHSHFGWTAYSPH